jgi:hypothetical protein
LISISEAVCQLAGVARPSRDARRSFLAMVKWFETNWSCVGPWLSIIHLRDEHGRIIDGAREVCERYASLD